MAQVKFRDRKTGDIYIKFDSTSLLKVVDESGLDLEEIGKEKRTYVYSHMLTTVKNIDGILQTSHKLKDIMKVPMNDGSEIEFRVEHINNCADYDDVYFVSKDIVGKSSMESIDDFLDKFTANMPGELLDIIERIDHHTSKGYHTNRKISILSKGNLMDTNGYCDGADDMVFEGLKTEADHCKNWEEETEWYWLDSPGISTSTNFYSVNTNGAPGGTGNASSVIGVVPCFKIRIKRV